MLGKLIYNEKYSKWYRPYLYNFKLKKVSNSGDFNGGKLFAINNEIFNRWKYNKGDFWIDFLQNNGPYVGDFQSNINNSQEIRRFNNFYYNLEVYITTDRKILFSIRSIKETSKNILVQKYISENFFELYFAENKNEFLFKEFERYGQFFHPDSISQMKFEKVGHFQAVSSSNIQNDLASLFDFGEFASLVNSDKLKEVPKRINREFIITNFSDFKNFELDIEDTYMFDDEYVEKGKFPKTGTFTTNSNDRSFSIVYYRNGKKKVGKFYLNDGTISENLEIDSLQKVVTEFELEKIGKEILIAKALRQVKYFADGHQINSQLINNISRNSKNRLNYHISVFQKMKYVLSKIVINLKKLLSAYILTIIIEFCVMFLWLRKKIGKMLIFISLCNFFTVLFANSLFIIGFNFFLIESIIVIAEFLLILFFFKPKILFAFLISITANSLTMLLSFFIKELLII